MSGKRLRGYALKAFGRIHEAARSKMKRFGSRVRYNYLEVLSAAEQCRSTELESVKAFTGFSAGEKEFLTAVLSMSFQDVHNDAIYWKKSLSAQSGALRYKKIIKEKYKQYSKAAARAKKTLSEAVKLINDAPDSCMCCGGLVVADDEGEHRFCLSCGLKCTDKQYSYSESVISALNRKNERFSDIITRLSIDQALTTTLTRRPGMNGIMYQYRDEPYNCIPEISRLIRKAPDSYDLWLLRFYLLAGRQKGENFMGLIQDENVLKDIIESFKQFMYLYNTSGAAEHDRAWELVRDACVEYTALATALMAEAVGIVCRRVDFAYFMTHPVFFVKKEVAPHDRFSKGDPYKLLDKHMLMFDNLAYFDEVLSESAKSGVTSIFCHSFALFCARINKFSFERGEEEIRQRLARYRTYLSLAEDFYPDTDSDEELITQYKTILERLFPKKKA